MTKEQEMNFYVSDAKMVFDIENVDGEEEVILETSTGYELFEKIGLYEKQNYKKLFENESLPVNHAHLKYVLITHEQDGIKFNLRLNGDDGAYAKLTFNQEKLNDENANKVAMMREILDFDREAETSLLREFMKKNS